MNTTQWIGVCLSALLLTSTACSKKEETATPVTPVPITTSTPSQVALWVTTPTRSILFHKQTTKLNFSTATNANTTITVDTATTYQTMDGFGFTLTGGSASLIHQMNTTARAALLRELFATDSTWTGVSYLRLSIGASDLSSSAFTYDDLSIGQTDVNLNQFSLAHEQTDLIPVLKEILAINPDIKILGSPWSAPAWMKDNNSLAGGNLSPTYYDAYARYFVKYIQGMLAEGIRIDAITVQNEPLNANNNPSMTMSAAEQANFIGNYLGPAFHTAGINTKIIAYDHNADRLDYPTAVLNDATANGYVDGSAFHLYGGTIDALSRMHSAFPNKNIYFTEQYTDAGTSFADALKPSITNLIIGAPLNWSRNVLQWNLAADASNNPHTNGGCAVCLPAVTISGSSVTRNVAYYTIAHASKFVRPGSVRIASSALSNLPNVAYQRPDGKKVLIVLNNASAASTFNIAYRGKIVVTTLSTGAVGTYIW